MNILLDIGIIIFFVASAAIFFYFWKKYRRKGLRPDQLQYIKAHWIRIIDSFDSHSHQAVMDADKLLDYVLKCYGYEGHLGEKLKVAKGHFSDLDGVWSAHKLRNTLAHEFKQLSQDEGRRALRQFKQALNDLGAKL